MPVAEVTHKSVQDRFVSAPADAAIQPVKSTKTAEALDRRRRDAKEVN